MSMSFDLNYEISRMKELCTKVKTVSDFEKLARIAKGSYEQYPDAEPLVFEYLNFLSEILSKQDEEMELEKILREARRVYKQSSFSERVFIQYFKILSDYLLKQEDKPDLVNIISEAKEIYELYPQNNQFALWYLSVLCHYVWKKDDNSERINTVNEASRIFNIFSREQQFGLWYLKVLSNFSFKQEEKSELINIVNEAKRVYEFYSPTEELAIEYLNVLFNLSLKQDDYEAKQNTLNEVRKVYEENQASAMIATIYLRSLYNFSQNQSEDIWNNAKKQAKLFYEKYPLSETVASWYMGFLLTSTKKQINVAEMKGTTKIISDIIQKHFILADLVEKHIDVLLADATESYIDNCADLLMCFAEQNSVKDYLMQTKYGIFFDLDEFPQEELKKLVQIFSLVQTIKNQLIVKDPEELKCGHYTSAKDLQLLLKQNEKEKYAIKSRSRLSNVNYMNDPSEGKILNQFLKLDTTSQKISLKASPWFLMSLTTAIDRLEMWAQYGKQGKGVCLVLGSSDFLKVSSYSDMEWITAKRFVEWQDVDLDNKRIEEDTPINKLMQGDFLYRIGYLVFPSKTDELLTIENNPRLKDAISIINSSLINLREKVQTITKETNLYEKVDECLEEIRYLFKSADYKYEEELRILKFNPLDSDDSKIKIDNSEETAKLYLERDNPIKIAEVIFGPKFSKPENVTPLLQLLDKNIKFSQSKIPFK